MTLIATWNVNSVNARIYHLQNLFREKNPDVVLLQEIKCLEKAFPFDVIEEFGYNIEVFGQKSYNGTAILSKYPIEDLQLRLPTLSTDWPQDARYIEGFINAGGLPLRIASVYVPNGSEVGSEKFRYKLDFLKSLQQHMLNLNSEYENILIAGDLNVAPEEIDVYNAKSLDGQIGFHIDERNFLRSIMNKGFYDAFRLLHPEKQDFSWWDYRRGSFDQNKGMRIDHILLSPSASDSLVASEIFKEARSWDKASDHAPVLCKLR